MRWQYEPERRKTGKVVVDAIAQEVKTQRPEGREARSHEGGLKEASGTSNKRATGKIRASLRVAPTIWPRRKESRQGKETLPL